MLINSILYNLILAIHLYIVQFCDTLYIFQKDLYTCIATWQKDSSAHKFWKYSHIRLYWQHILQKGSYRYLLCQLAKGRKWPYILQTFARKLHKFTLATHFAKIFTCLPSSCGRDTWRVLSRVLEFFFSKGFTKDVVQLLRLQGSNLKKYMIYYEMIRVLIVICKSPGKTYQQEER